MGKRSHFSKPFRISRRLLVAKQFDEFLKLALFRPLFCQLFFRSRCLFF